MNTQMFRQRSHDFVGRGEMLLESLESRRLLADAIGALSVTIGDVNFYAQDHSLWRSNIDGSNPQLLNDFNGYGNPDQLIDYHGLLIFAADGGTSNGRELWRSDGTSEGTFMVKDLHLFGASSSPNNFMWVNGHLLLQASNQGWSQTLWVTDGTASGTQVISPHDDYGNNSSPWNLDVIGNRLYFEQSDHAPSEDSSYETRRYVTDGTVAGTRLASGGVIQRGVLRVFGTDRRDSISISSRGGKTTLASGSARQVFRNNQFDGIEVYGQLGNDWIVIDSSVQDDATVEGGGGVDSIRGGSGDDLISEGTSGNVTGGAGNDTIAGGNHIEGGDGDDTLFFGGTGEALGQDGNDYIAQTQYPSGDCLLDGGNGNDVIVGGYSGIQTLRGGNGNDTLDGSNSGADNLMLGGRGNDSLYGGGGNDTLDGNAGADTLEGGPGTDSVQADSLDTVIEFNEPSLLNGILTIQGTAHGDSIHVYLSGAELAVAVSGTLTTFVASDVLAIVINGLAGDDMLWASNGYMSPFLIPVSMYGGIGNDTLSAADGNDYLDGQSGNDMLSGAGGDDTLVGDMNDSIDGGAGNNQILPSLVAVSLRKPIRLATR